MAKGLELAGGLPTSPVDEVVGESMSTDVEDRVDEELPLQHVSESDPMWVGDEPGR
jgi:hypothetical protein